MHFIIAIARRRVAILLNSFVCIGEINEMQRSEGSGGGTVHMFQSVVTSMSTSAAVSRDSRSLATAVCVENSVAAGSAAVATIALGSGLHAAQVIITRTNVLPVTVTNGSPCYRGRNQYMVRVECHARVHANHQ